VPSLSSSAPPSSLLVADLARRALAHARERIERAGAVLVPDGIQALVELLLVGTAGTLASVQIFLPVVAHARQAVLHRRILLVGSDVGAAIFPGTARLGDRVCGRVRVYRGDGVGERRFRALRGRRAMSAARDCEQGTHADRTNASQEFDDHFYSSILPSLKFGALGGSRHWAAGGSTSRAAASRYTLFL